MISGGSIGGEIYTARKIDRWWTIAEKLPVYNITAVRVPVWIMTEHYIIRPNVAVTNDVSMSLGWRQ